MPFSRLNKHHWLPLLIAAVIGLSSCNSARKVVYIQNAEPNQTQILTSALNVKVRPGDDITVIVSCDDDHATSQLNLLSDTRRLQRSNGAKGTSSSSSGQNSLLSYTVQANGCIDFPILGEINVEGLTRNEIAAKIKQSIIDEGVLKDDSSLVVTVQFANLMYTAVGEVSAPGAYAIDRDYVTLFEAIGRAGDLTIYGRRDAVWVLREENGERKMYKVDLRSTDFMESPAYYVQQNDVIYVEPNGTRTGQSTVNETTFKSVGFWTSLVGVVISISTLIITLTRR